MRTCVNLHSAEIKFAAGTASFLREGLEFPHKKPFTKPRTRSISIGRIEPRLPVPRHPRTEVLNPVGGAPLRRGSHFKAPEAGRHLVSYPTKTTTRRY
jgi:hypothetical protein